MGDKRGRGRKNKFMQAEKIQRGWMRKIIFAAIFCECFAFLAAGQEVPKEPLENVTQLTSGFSRAGEGYFSSDMKWIIFQGAPVGQEQYQMYVARLHLGEGKAAIDAPIRISPEKSRNTCGYFSPDGKSLIFASTAGKEKPDEPTGGYQRQGRSYVWSFPGGMEIFRFDGWQDALANAKAGEIVDLAKKPLTNNEVYDAEGSFSPDGKHICFTRGGGKDADIYVMKSDGSGAVRITSAPGYDGGPFFSPDGKRLVYRSDRKSNDLLQVFVADLAFDAKGEITGAAGEHQLTNDGNVNWGPYWHPDGKHLIYATSAHGHANYELYMMRDDGSEKTRVTYKEGADVLPVFSPDGKWLMWTAKRTADNTTQLFIAKFKLAQ
jgi:Tol biopolymer transport system component